jgi:FkbM family methyltransferase
MRNKKRRLRHFVRQLILKLPRRLGTQIVAAVWKLRGHKTSISVSKDGYFLLSDQEETALWIFHMERLPIYAEGIEKRFERLSHEYWISDLQELLGPNQCNVCIDIGANVGEVSIIFRSKLRAKTILSIEPAHSEFECLRRNLQENSILLNCALWKNQQLMEFFPMNATGDSSLIRSSHAVEPIQVEAVSLDSLELLRDLEVIDVIKLEAEGAEPEIVEGGKSVFSRTRYVTADLGPERGLLKENTIHETTIQLERLGFKVIRSRDSGRQVYLFQNQNLL